MGLTIFLSLFTQCSLSLSYMDCVVNILNEAWHTVFSCLLHFDNFWLSLMVSIFCKKKLLGWWVRTTFICRYKPKLEESAGFCLKVWIATTHNGRGDLAVEQWNIRLLAVLLPLLEQRLMLQHRSVALLETRTSTNLMALPAIRVCLHPLCGHF